MSHKDTLGGFNLNDTDEARRLTLEQKRRTVGLQESEKEELKVLKDTGRRPI